MTVASVTSTQKTLLQTPPPTRLDVKARLAEQGRDGAIASVSASVGASAQSVLGGLKTAATPYDPNTPNPEPEAVRAAGLQGKSLLTPSSYVNIASFSTSGPVAEDVQSHATDATIDQSLALQSEKLLLSKSRENAAIHARDTAKLEAAQEKTSLRRAEARATEAAETTVEKQATQAETQTAARTQEVQNAARQQEAAVAEERAAQSFRDEALQKERSAALAQAIEKQRGAEEAQRDAERNVPPPASSAAHADASAAYGAGSSDGASSGSVVSTTV